LGTDPTLVHILIDRCYIARRTFNWCKAGMSTPWPFLARRRYFPGPQGLGKRLPNCFLFYHKPIDLWPSVRLYW